MRASAERGQALLLVVAGMGVLVLGAAMLAAIASGLTGRGGQQRAADLAALAAGRSMASDHPRVYEPALVDGQPNPRHLERSDYLHRAQRTAEATARANGVQAVAVSFPGSPGDVPLRVRVAVLELLGAGGVDASVTAEAELAPLTIAPAGVPSAGEYGGPYATRQGQRMRPDVALAYDRMAAAAREAGHALVITSGFRSDAEQAILFARNPDPKWVAPPGKSLHRTGTELDLGPSSAYGWLAANAGRFGFLKRYAWEPWHFGYTRNAGSRSLGYGAPRRSRGRGGGDGRGTLPDFVPARYAPVLARAAQRWNVSAALLAAQVYAESGFNPYAVSSAGARGIAQFMPATAASYGLRNPFDAEAAIDAQAHLMRDLLRQLGSVPLALAGYNAGPARVRACGCIPPYPETQAYVARILALLGGAGLDASGGGIDVRLVA